MPSLVRQREFWNTIVLDLEMKERLLGVRNIYRGSHILGDQHVLIANLHVRNAHKL